MSKNNTIHLTYWVECKMSKKQYYTFNNRG